MAGITYEAVVVAVNQVIAQGQNPTIERVRLHLGTGSNSTIVKHLNTWRQQQSSLLDEKSPAPPDIVKIAAEHAWQEIRKEAEARIAVIEEKADSKLSQAAEECKQAISEVEQANEHLNALQEEYNACLAQKELLNLDVKKLQQSCASLEMHKSRLEEQLQLLQVSHANQFQQLKLAHEKEIQRMQEQLHIQTQSSQQCMSEMKTQHVEVNHQAMLTIDFLKVELKQLQERLNDHKQMIHQKDSETMEAKAALAAHLKEREESLQLFSIHTKKWDALYNKQLISDDLLMKINSMPQVEALFGQLAQTVANNMQEMLMSVNENIKRQIELMKAYETFAEQVETESC